ncbi:MAG: ribosome biogenesis GTP-binding protein YihA/YsxC [Bacteroidetes bacterium]|nr:ribosome biogenesis GTP-binding protein YihA/YsxC [Bacteroidota bacterium]MBU1116080.1 ribosome biogenesis GTP-binding protein YihA/YsxC [Bacteroidota bacterium]MBU1799152.1 ribosome biogenesis GTP-binding protein YihA/YsxC [Bacteroidota bacterium]
MKNIEFVKSVSVLNQLPVTELKEIVLAGRSNVGKSTFINSLFKKKGLAKTSSTPGKTRTINYYLVDSKYYIVDLPGFGYAKVAKKERDYWERLLITYFSENKNISRVIHFIDSRHKPTQLDVLLNDYLKELNLPYIVILNKIDKLKQSEVVQCKKDVLKQFPELSLGDNLFLNSSIKEISNKDIYSLLNNTMI